MAGSTNTDLSELAWRLWATVITSPVTANFLQQNYSRGGPFDTWGGDYGFHEKKIVQQIIENK